MSSAAQEQNNQSAPAILRYKIKEVANSAELDSFINVPWTVFKDTPSWSPPLRFERKQLLSPKSNPYFEHAEARYFVATKDGEPIGRISAQVCELVQQRMGQGTGQFGFFDCIDDKSLSADLFAHADNWLRTKNMTRVMGPFNLSINEEVGLLIEGFDTPPYFLMPHGKAYYPAFVEAAGFTKAKDMFAYWLDICVGPTPNITKMVEWGLRNEKFRLRSVNRKKFDEELLIILDIFNDAWSDNWGYIPMTPAEIDKAAKDLKPLIKDFNAKILEYEGEPAAFMVAVPDINRWIQDMDGDLLPFNWAKLAYRFLRQKSEHTRVPLMGVRKSFQKTRAGGVMALMLIETMRIAYTANGSREAELSWILEDNHGMREMLTAIGCKIYKTYRVYEKAL